jgi:hypothetical protein
VLAAGDFIGEESIASVPGVRLCTGLATSTAQRFAPRAGRPMRLGFDSALAYRLLMALNV